MNPKRIAVKFFAAPDPRAEVDLEPFIALFHRLIQQSSVEGLLLDVANYIHVPNGPGVVLIGHDVDYGIDATGGRTGLLTLRKRAGDQSLGDLLTDTLRKALGAVREIEADGSGKISFALDTLEIDVVDRLAAANEDAAYEQVKAAVEPVLKTLYGGANVTVAREQNDPRAPLRLSVTASEAADVATLLERLPASEAGGAARAEVPGPAVPGQSEWDISVEQLKQLRDEGADFVLVDVREQHEVDICEIGGMLIPLGTLEARLDELDKGAHVVVHCHLGGRSAHATRLLRANGFANAWNVQGGIRAWIQRIDSTLEDY
jgi:adenylyltransferase/sulfurtransferase